LFGLATPKRKFLAANNVSANSAFRSRDSASLEIE
jgi:hypothetical protein